MQLLIWAPLRALFFYFGRLEVKNWGALEKLPRSFLIVSNHMSYLDMFLVSHLFPFGARFFPIRYSAAPEHYYTWKRPFMWALGAYPIVRGEELEATLGKSIEILKRGGRIMMFPEGKIHRLGRRRNPRRGVSYLAAACNVPILPCFIEGFKPTHYQIGFSWKDLFLRRYRLLVVFGDSFFLREVYPEIPTNDEEYRDASEKIIDRVYELQPESNGRRREENLFVKPLLSR